MGYKRLGLTKNEKRIRVYTRDQQAINQIQERFPQIHFKPYYHNGHRLGYVSDEAPNNPDRVLTRIDKYMKVLESQGYEFGLRSVHIP